MPLKKSKGNMYPWVTHTHSHLGGQCPHKCTYCYVQATEKRAKTGRYVGPVRLIEDEFAVNYGKDKTIFIEHMNDLFAKDVPNDFIRQIIAHCLRYPNNTYMFQTKNPQKIFKWMLFLPQNSIIGTTIETNREEYKTSEAIPVSMRHFHMCQIPSNFKRFVTIEPVLDFDVDILASWIANIKPDFVNLGADSKGHDLPEPTVEKIMKFVEKLKSYGIELREKYNLQRLKQK